jgi:hypothetical protein
MRWEGDEYTAGILMNDDGQHLIPDIDLAGAWVLGGRREGF